MPFIAAIAAFIANIATLIGAQVGGVVAGVTGSTAVGAAVSNAVYYGAQALVYSALGTLVSPDVPKPEQGHASRRQTIPPRRYGYGIARVSGAGKMLWEARKNKAYDVDALVDHRIEEYLNFYLNDDKGHFSATATTDLLGITPAGWVKGKIGGDNRYGFTPVRVWLGFREGLATETAYSEITADLSAEDVWTANHRLDGVASAGMITVAGKIEDFNTHFPNGHPELSVVAKLRWVYDPRQPTHNPADESTWAWSDNCALVQMHHDWIEDDLDFDVAYADTLDSWIQAANDCDDLIDLDAGGTEKRYRLGGFYDGDNDPADVRRRILASYDGWVGENGEGGRVCFAGKYRAPTMDALTLAETGGEIVEYDFATGPQADQAVSQLMISYTSPEHDYSMVEADPWGDPDRFGRPMPLQLEWVQSPTQARRLAKRKDIELQGMSGQLTLNLGGLRVLGQRYIPVEISDDRFSLTKVFQAARLTIDIMSLSAVLEVVEVDETVDDWDEATEEGTTPTPPPTTPPTALTAPTIDDADPVPATGGTTISIDATGPTRTDLTWAVRWRVDGGADWSTEAFRDVGDGPSITIVTGLVTQGVDVEVEVAYRTAAGETSPWSATTTVTIAASGGPLDSLGTGMVAKTATNTYAARTHTGTTAEITVTNGSGVSGNPTYSLPTALTFTGKTVTGGTFSGVTLSGTTTLPSSGVINSTVADFATGGRFQSFGSGASGPGIEVGFNTGTDKAYVSSINRTGNVSKALIISATEMTPDGDNIRKNGSASLRWSEVFAAIGTITTSDARDKTPVRPLTPAEISAAQVLAREIGTFQWLEAVKLKGKAGARTHIGLTVQRAIEIMADHGLAPLAYGFICHDSWEAEPRLYGFKIDKAGRKREFVASEARPAGDRYGFRPDQLNLFISRGLEARLTALESATVH